MIYESNPTVNEANKAATQAKDVGSPSIFNFPGYQGPTLTVGNKTKLSVFDCIKYLWSTVATLGSVAIIMYGISIESYVLPVNVAGVYKHYIPMIFILQSIF